MSFSFRRSAMAAAAVLISIPCSLVSLRANQGGTLQLVSAENVNSRYTVQSVSVAGETNPPKLSPSLRQRLEALVGARLDLAELDGLARALRDELHLRAVEPRVLRGTAPNTVRVELQIERRTVEFDVSVPQFLFASHQGWSAEAQAGTTIARNHVVRFSILSDGDKLPERVDGFTAAYENRNFGSPRIHFAFLVEGLHEQWSHSTATAEGSYEPDLYRARRNFEPEIILLVSRDLALTLGASFETLDMENPRLRSEDADALLAGLRFHHEGEESELTAVYSLRAASSAALGDFSYLRQRATAVYTLKLGRATISDSALAGLVSGHAPLFERFVLGNGSTLRGWNRYDIDPLGGNRVLHNSVEGSYHVEPGSIECFYDAGIIWNQSQAAPLRHSVGIGYRQSVFSVALAFPLRAGHIEPTIMVGMNR